VHGLLVHVNAWSAACESSLTKVALERLCLVQQLLL
jgi:hypothetical protein